METQAYYKQFLSFNRTKNQIKWTGTEECLREFAKILVYGTTEDSEAVEMCEDPSHNLVTFKLNNTVVKWYKSTQTLLVQGTSHSQFKDKLLEVLHEDSDALELPPNGLDETTTQDTSQAVINVSERDTVSHNVPKAKIEEPRQTGEGKNSGGVEDSVCPSVKSEMNAINNAIVTLSKQIMQILPQSKNDQPDAEREALKEENLYLKMALKDRENQIKLLEMERMSLLTALRLVHEDKAAETAPKVQAHTPSPSQDHVEQTQNGDNWITVVSKKKKRAATESENQGNKRDERPKKSIVILGDSLTKNLQGHKMSKACKVVSKSFPGSSVEDMTHYMAPTVEKHPDEIILHVGTTNLQTDEPRIIADKVTALAMEIKKKSSKTQVTISSLITRKDAEVNKTRVEETNQLLKSSSVKHHWKFIDHSNIDETSLNRGGLHLNRKGQGFLARNLISHIKDSN